ncbi:MAG: carboxypeptidase regulatory-like domain-containing protein [Deltaproteobacteria bacterium]|nr:carboxypeptidase regulatory-like domain-containing protein [Deltaproteobacteria bacterium]
MLRALLAFAVLASGCGEDINDADPRLIPGGGVGDGAIKKKINVYVIDEDTDQPVGGADVLVGESEETPLEGITDSTGLFTLEDDSLSGAQTITVVADGYTVSTWLGANGANVTIPLSPTTPAGVPHALLEGTIEGWDSLPAPDTDHILLGLVSYSQTDDLGDPANEIEQPSVGGGVPANACVLHAQGSQCDWDLNVRPGTIALAAVIVDMDTKGTLTDDDDTVEVIGYAYKLGVVAEAGVDQSGLILEQVEIGGLTDVTVNLANAPSGLLDVGVVMGINLGDQGIMVLGLQQDAEGDTVLPLPKLEGDFAGAQYRATSYATTNFDADDSPSSLTVKRGITDLASPIQMGEWLMPATDLSYAAGQYSFTGVAGSPIHVVNFRDPSNNKVWDVAVLDGRSAFSLPVLDPDPLPSGSYDMSVGAYDGAADPMDFGIDEFLDVFERASTARETITP